MKTKTKNLIIGFWVGYILALPVYMLYEYFRYGDFWPDLKKDLIRAMDNGDLAVVLILYPILYLIFVFALIYIPKFVNWVDSKL